MNSRIILSVVFILIVTTSFAQRPDMSLIPYRKGDVWGYANPDKQIVIATMYNETDLFYEGYGLVKKGDKYGYINKAGKMIIPAKFYSAKHFRFGYFDNPAKHKTDTVLYAGAALRTDGYERCFNTKGVQMAKCPAINENIQPATQIVETVSEKVYSNIKANGDIYDKIVDDYKLGNDNDDNYYIATKNGTYGVFNNKFEVVVPFNNQSIKKIMIGGKSYLLVQKDGMYGILNSYGVAIVPVDNNNVQYVRTVDGKDYFFVTKDGGTMVEDGEMKNIFKGNYTNVSYETEGGFIVTGSNQLKGYYFLNTGMVINPKYTDVRSIRGGDYIWITTQTGKHGFINSHGVEFFEE